VEACNRLKGGKLPKEKIKLQLQKIANSRTGGMKTDEALGKSGGGPEGLPHSIIVTEEGLEGEVAAASPIDGVKPSPDAPDGDLLGDSPPPESKPEKPGRKTAARHSGRAAGRRKADQMALFGKGDDAKPSRKGTAVGSKRQPARRKR
jgi:DNA topoisomerase-6 subunit B